MSSVKQIPDWLKAFKSNKPLSYLDSVINIQAQQMAKAKNDLFLKFIMEFVSIEEVEALQDNINKIPEWVTDFKLAAINPEVEYIIYKGKVVGQIQMRYPGSSGQWRTSGGKLDVMSSWKWEAAVSIAKHSDPVFDQKLLDYENELVKEQLRRRDHVAQFLSKRGILHTVITPSIIDAIIDYLKEYDNE